jgi:hypothetical protein
MRQHNSTAQTTKKLGPLGDVKCRPGSRQVAAKIAQERFFTQSPVPMMQCGEWSYCRSRGYLRSVWSVLGMGDAGARAEAGTDAALVRFLKVGGVKRARITVLYGRPKLRALTVLRAARPVVELGALVAAGGDRRGSVEAIHD